MTTRNIYVIRPFGYNIGNDVIFYGLKKLVKALAPWEVNFVSMPATDRYDKGGRAGLTAQTIHEINRFGAGVIVGGGNLFENGELDLDLEALDRLRVPMMLYSLAHGRIYDERGRLQERTDSMSDKAIWYLCEKAAVVAPRDSGTAARLSIQHDSTVGCPTMFLPAEQVQKKDWTSECLLSVRAPELMNVPEKWRARMFTVVQEIIAEVQSRGQVVTLLCHDHRDLPFASAFEVGYRYTRDVKEYLGWIANCDLLVTFRLHSFVPAVGFRVPAINISYDERAARLVEDIGFGRWNIDLIQEYELGVLKNRLGLAEKATKDESLWFEYRMRNANAMSRFFGEIPTHLEVR